MKLVSRMDDSPPDRLLRTESCWFRPLLDLHEALRNFPGLPVPRPPAILGLPRMRFSIWAWTGLFTSANTELIMEDLVQDVGNPEWECEVLNPLVPAVPQLTPVFMHC